MKLNKDKQASSAPMRAADLCQMSWGLMQRGCDVLDNAWEMQHWCYRIVWKRGS